MIPLHPQILSKNGKNEFVILPYEEFISLQEFLEIAEDLKDLRIAKKEEAQENTFSLEEIKTKFGMI